MIIESYSLRLLCDFCDDPVQNRETEFRGKNLTRCYRDAIIAGWHTYAAQGKAKCPVCYKAGRKVKP